MPLQTTSTATNSAGEIQEIVLLESRATFNPPFDCKAVVYAIGAGGGGAGVTHYGIVTSTSRHGC